MPEIVPSFLQKLNRAEKHFVELKAEFDRYAARHPYTVSTTIQGKRKRKVRRLTFTELPENTDMSIIAADLVYNLRSGLDHLAACLVPAHDRDSVSFPIFWKGVWEKAVPGENQERTKARQRWMTYTRHMPAPAVAIIKSLQPDQERIIKDKIVNTLAALNRLSNTDRHSKLPVTAATVRHLRLDCVMPDGTILEGMSDHFHERDSLENGAEIRDVPYSAVEVKASGVPVVLLSFSDPERHMEIPDSLAQLINAVRGLIVEPLVPYVRVHRAAAKRAVAGTH